MTDKLPLIELFFSLSILALAIWELYRTPNPRQDKDGDRPADRDEH